MRIERYLKSDQLRAYVTLEGQPKRVYRVAEYDGYCEKLRSLQPGARITLYIFEHDAIEMVVDGDNVMSRKEWFEYELNTMWTILFLAAFFLLGMVSDYFWKRRHGFKWTPD